MNIYEKLSIIQSDLKAPKNQFNKFGNYNYRSLEDICEGLKPLLLDKKVSLTISDEIFNIGDRVYIKAVATLTDIDKPDDKIINTALARESLTKKGMDDSQITGSTSSYARKYCLNGLFCIDDTKDADSINNDNGSNKKEQQKPQTELMNKEQSGRLITLCENQQLKQKETAEKYNISKTMTKEAFELAFKKLMSDVTTGNIPFDLIEGD